MLGYEMIQTKLRNKLGNKKAAKFSFLSASVQPK